MPDPRAMLEVSLRFYTCITLGDTIRVEGFGKTFDLDVLDIKPKSKYNCICTINTDVEVDFAPPLDYQELPKFGKK
jgi:ubiquitin fusion degradation protein 1